MEAFWQYYPVWAYVGLGVVAIGVAVVVIAAVESYRDK